MRVEASQPQTSPSRPPRTHLRGRLSRTWSPVSRAQIAVQRVRRRRQASRAGIGPRSVSAPQSTRVAHHHDPASGFRYRPIPSAGSCPCRRQAGSRLDRTASTTPLPGCSTGRPRRGSTKRRAVIPWVSRPGPDGSPSVPEGPLLPAFEGRHGEQQRRAADRGEKCYEDHSEFPFASHVIARVNGQPPSALTAKPHRADRLQETPTRAPCSTDLGPSRPPPAWWARAGTADSMSGEGGRPGEPSDSPGAGSQSHCPAPSAQRRHGIKVAGRECGSASAELKVGDVNRMIGHGLVAALRRDTLRDLRHYYASVSSRTGAASWRCCGH